MLIFNGKKYAKNDAEFTESLFHRAGTCNGFYKRYKNHVKIYTQQKELVAAISTSLDGYYQSHTAYTENGRNVLLPGMTDATEKFLGLDGLSFMQQADAAKAIAL